MAWLWSPKSSKFHFWCANTHLARDNIKQLFLDVPSSVNAKAVCLTGGVSVSHLGWKLHIWKVVTLLAKSRQLKIEVQPTLLDSLVSEGQILSWECTWWDMDNYLAKRVSFNNLYKYKLLQGGFYMKITFIDRGDDFVSNFLLIIESSFSMDWTKIKP